MTVAQARLTEKLVTWRQVEWRLFAKMAAIGQSLILIKVKYKNAAEQLSCKVPSIFQTYLAKNMLTSKEHLEILKSSSTSFSVKVYTVVYPLLGCPSSAFPLQEATVSCSFRSMSRYIPASSESERTHPATTDRAH